MSRKGRRIVTDCLSTGKHVRIKGTGTLDLSEQNGGVGCPPFFGPAQMGDL
jgi:hypothetical protein